MPIYEYRCEACQHELEALQKMSDEPLVTCPKCGAAALRKQVSAAGFRLKGGGWYETDFKSGGRKNVSGDKDGAAKEGAGKDAAAKDGTAASDAKTSSGSGESAAPAPAPAASSGGSGGDGARH